MRDRYGLYRNAYYTNTSEAYELEYDIYNNPKKIKKRKKVLRNTKYITVEKNVKFLSLKFFSTLTVLSSLFICTIFINALTIQKRFEIQDLQVNLKELKENNKYLETEIAKNLDLDYVEKFSSQYLNMQKPANYQVVYIDVPKESYTVKEQDSSTQNNTQNFFGRVFNLGKLLNKD